MLQGSDRSKRLGLVATIAVGIAVAISSFTVVRAAHISSAELFSCSKGVACVEGNSSGGSTWGVYGSSTTDTGVHGTTASSKDSAGVSGKAEGTSGHAYGVYGVSSNGEGVYGTTASANAQGAVVGAFTGSATQSSVSGVTGTSSAGAGVYGLDTDGFPGVEGFSDGPGVVGISVSGSTPGGALMAEGVDADTWIFYGFNEANSTNCAMDNEANLSCTGTIQGGARVQIEHTTSTNRHVLSYASESATPTIEDLGAAQMRDGIANVGLPADFASVMSRSNPYYVFLTPMGDTRGLYVSSETSAGFQVRENMHGHSNVVFQYRIIAVPLDAKNVRLPNAPEVQRPRPPKLPR
jgi:hypothetical protein